MVAGVPPEVVRVQEALAARSRLVILRELLGRPMTFAELHGRVEMSLAALRAGLSDLAEAGYVSDDSPAGRQRKPTSAVFTVDRDLVLRDVTELLLYLAR